MRSDKIPITHIAFATIAITLISSVVVFTSNISFGQTVQSGQQQPPPMGVKIISPSKDDQVSIGNNNKFEISGISTDNTNTDCRVSIILNNAKPYQEAVPTGPTGKGDYSTWSFTLTPSYNATLKEGSNKLTAKQSCANPNESALATHYSVFFNGVNSDDNSRAVETTSISTQQQREIEQQQEQEQSPPSITTPATPSRSNDTIAQLSVPALNDDTKKEDISNTDNNKETKGTASKTTTSIAERGSTAPQTARTMTFTIYQEGKLDTSSNTTRQGGTTTQKIATSSPSPEATPANTCNQNLPISRFSAIGDDGDDAIPQNAFDNNLLTRWSHNSMGSWIIVDLGSDKAICTVDISWYRGNERSYDFIISLSKDGTNFKNVHAGTSTGNTLSGERYPVMNNNPTSSNPATAVASRYVRITVNGNTDSDTDQNQWAAITEIDVNGRDSDGTSEVSAAENTNSNQLLSSSPLIAATSLEKTGEEGDTMIMKISGIYESGRDNKNSDQLPPLDPPRLEGTLSILDSKTNEKTEEYDLAPINITFTQLFKKITVTTGIDDPITNGSVISTLKFPSPIDLHNEGNQTSLLKSDETTAESRGTVGNMLIAKISGEHRYSMEDTRGSITIRPLPMS